MYLPELLPGPVETGGGVLSTGEEDQCILLLIIFHLSLFFMWFPKLHRRAVAPPCAKITHFPLFDSFSGRAFKTILIKK
jgi:hypothetical protein